MAKTTTLKNLNTEKLLAKKSKANVPSQERIDFILNYSKALNASSSKKIGRFFTVLN